MEKIKEHIRKKLKENKMRVTQSRLAVADILARNSEKFLSAEEIHKRIESSKLSDCDRVSVYRILCAYDELSLLSKSTFQGEAVKYKIISDCCLEEHSHDNEHEEDHHHHYFKCTKCKTVESFTGCVLGTIEKQFQKKGYQNLSHHLEITGLCPTCA
jgi:Fur family ferric uptake transcriptional regulator